jgi:hypothetical protein
VDSSAIDALGLPVLTPLLVAIVAFTVWILQVLKRAVYKHTKLKRHIPSSVWWLLSVAIPVGLVVGANLDWFQALASHFLPPGMSFSLEGYGSVATGVVTAIAGNGTFATMKRLGLTEDHAPDAPAVVPVVPEPAAPIPEPAPIPEVEAPAVPQTGTARLLSDWTGYVPDYVLIEEGGVQRLLPLK